MQVHKLVSAAVAVVAFVIINVTPALAGPDPKGSVPVPGSLILLVTGAAGIAAAGWWTRKK
jgi:hypothetical protein